MDVKFEFKPDIQPVSGVEDNDCLVDLANQAESTQGGVNENLALTTALDQHVLIDAQDGDVELMCQRCPVQCTAKLVGGSALLLVHNREECLDN